MKQILTYLLCLTLPLSAQEEALKPARDAMANGDVETALKLLKVEAEKGSSEAANLVADTLLKGAGGRISNQEARKWLEKAVSDGDAAGNYNLSILLMTAPEGIEKDAERARFLMQAAAEKGHAAGQYEFARMLESEINLNGPRPDWREARSWMEKAAEQKLPGALFSMVRYFDEGLAGEANPDKGTEFCIEAAKGGLPAAMNEMGVRYQKGKGIHPDNVAAIGCFTLAAQYNVPVAHVNLGKCYANGEGLMKDYNKAGEQFAAASKLNYPPGQYMLAQLFENGLGTESDPLKAFVLYSRPAKGGVPEAAARRDGVEKVLTAVQRAEAEKMLATGK